MAAVLLLVLPYAAILVVLILYAIVAATGASGTIGSVLRLALGILGVVSVIGIIAGIPIAIIVGSRRKELVAQFDSRSGTSDDSQFPPELKKWNWGAAGLSIIWGVYHGVWVSFVVLIPYVNWIWWIIMGLEGNKWAWQKRHWRSIEEFQEAQKKWKIWGIIFLFLPIILVALGFIAAIIGTFIQ